MGQSAGDSPYSAYGLGNLVGNTQVSQLLMGGVSVAVTDPAGISPFNPASYVSLRKTALEGGFAGQYSRVRDQDETDERTRTQLLGFTLGVPWSNGKWGLGIGLLPVSNVGYLVGDTDTLGSGGTVKLSYEGTGGLNRGFAGLARTLWRSKADSTGRVRSRLALGVNVNYLFGTVEQTRKAVYPAGANYANFSSYTGLVLRGAGFNAGVHFGTELVSLRTLEQRRRMKSEQERKEHEQWLLDHPGQERAAPRPYRAPVVPTRLLLGFSAELPADLGARRTLLEKTYITANSVDYTQDTTLYKDGQEGTLYIPPSFGVGAAVQSERWSLSGDVRWRDWGAMRLDVQDYSLSGDLRPSFTYSLGASFRPAWDQDRNYFKRVIYRAGARYTTDYLRVQDIQMNEAAFTLGLSLPISEGNYLSRINLGVMAGGRGKAGETTVEERFANFYFGITLTPNLRERWFAPTHIE